MQFRLRVFLICVSLFLAKPLLQSYTRFNLELGRLGKVNNSLKCITCKWKPILKFFNRTLKKSDLGLGIQGFKKSFFYFFKNPHKKIKKRFFLKFKKIKKRFFKYSIKDSTGVRNSLSEEEIGGVTDLSLVSAKGSSSSTKFLRCFLRKAEFLCELNRKRRSKMVSSGFTFFGQRFTGKNNDLKILTLMRSLYRVGRYRSYQILLKFRRNFNMRLFSLSTKFRVSLEVFLRNLIINEAFKRVEENNFNRKLAVRSYHSTRFRLSLPIRGQRTHSNAGTPKRLQSRLKAIVS